MLEQAEKESLRVSELSNAGAAACEAWPVQLVSNGYQPSLLADIYSIFLRLIEYLYLDQHRI